MAGFGPGLQPAAAQTMPRVSFSIAPGPALDSSVWPADFNRDGRIDLLGAVRWSSNISATDLMLATGRGDGTFNPPRSLGIAAEAYAIADVNRDNRLDAIVRTDTAIGILPGRGDGTFSALRVIQPINPDLVPYSLPIVAGDFTGDGRIDVALLDLRVGEDPVLRFFPGNGDFTFGTPAEVPAPNGVSGAVAGDFNRDGRLDLAYSALWGEVHVLLNNGSGFADTVYGIAYDLADIATADLSGDGRLDLIVAQFNVSGPPSPGRLSVFLGRGDGTFAPDVEYEAGVDGEHDLAIGDFTRDGILDVATANRSAWFADDFGTQNGDSISVLAGDGTGRLDDPVSFPLGGENGDAYQDRVNLIRAADLDRDGYLDLVTSPAVIFLNRPPVPNRPPVVFVGPDRTLTTEDLIALHAIASDPDGHFLRYSWSTSRSRGPWTYSFGGTEPGVYTTTVTVDDGAGGVASDSVTFTIMPWASERWLDVSFPPAGALLAPGTPFVVRWAHGPLPFDRFDLFYSVDAGRTFTPVAGCQALAGTVDHCTWTTPAVDTDDALLRLVGTYGSNQWLALSNLFAITNDPPPAGPTWQHRDVGAVGRTGDASYDAATGTFTVRGAGADIWGTADEFHYVYLPVGGLHAGIQITARVASVENINAWTKVGVMFRTHLGPSSPHASLFVTPSTLKGTAFQRRIRDGEVSVHTAGPKVTAPVWLRLTLQPTGVVRAFVRYGDNPWLLVGEDSIDVRDHPVTAGLVVSSHVDRTLATGVFDGVTVGPLGNWSEGDIGAVGVPGRGTTTETSVTMEGSGADIWGTADAFRFRSIPTPAAANVRVAARVVAVENTNPWAKAGVMIREGKTAGSPHVMVIVSPGRGVAMQYRAVADGISRNVAIVPGLAPKWVRLTRNGARFVGEMSDDGAAWQVIGEIDVATMSQTTHNGLAVTSHNNGVLATASFENVSVETLPWP